MKRLYTEPWSQVWLKEEDVLTASSGGGLLTPDPSEDDGWVNGQIPPR